MIYGYKKTQLFYEFIGKYIPQNIEVYCEPFGGEFSIFNYLSQKPKFSIYNDINTYDVKIDAHVIHHLDYKEIFKMYNEENVVWYLDPPYVRKEFLYQGCENYSEDFHVELKNEIQKLKGKVILSYEDCNFIRELYNEFNIFKYSGEKRAFRNELIITKTKIK